MNDVLDISDQENAIHEFANAKTTDHDTLQTKRVLQKVRKHIDEFASVGMHPNSVSFMNKNRRSSRIIIYDLEKLQTSKNLFVVIFYAHTRENLPEEFNKEFFETDWKIAMSMVAGDDILCYASQQLPNGNWFNLVLFTKESAKHHVSTNPIHRQAAYTLAPKRFTWIRLHNAYMPEGMMQHKEIALKDTKYYNFDNNWFARRKY